VVIPHILSHGRLSLRLRPKRVSGRVLIFLIEIYGPVLRLVGFILRAIYRVLFSWWLIPALVHRSQKSFADEIKQAAPFLFAPQYGGKVISDPRPQTRDSSFRSVCIASGNLFLRFSQWRMESYSVRVSPTLTPNDSYDLLDALCVVDPAAITELPPEIDGWYHFAGLLEPKFEQMQRSFNPENFTDSKRKFDLLRVGKLHI